MYGLHLTTGSKYFANVGDFSITITNDCPDSFNLEGTQIRVAIFGGSSSAGYASPISFSKILCDYSSKDKNLVITNFSKSGAPFSDFQSEIIKEVMSDYDLLVIYAGHNEVWSQIYRRENKTIFPNGIETSDPKKVHFNHLEELVALKQKPTRRKQIKNFIIEESRIYYFLLRSIARLKILVNKSDELNGEVYPRNFYYKDTFLTEFERKNILENYKNNIEEISNKLNSKQKLIIATVLSNDLFPPIADIYIEADEQTGLDGLNKKLKNLYSQISDNNLDKIKEVIFALPVGANKHYLEGLLCLELKGKLLTKFDNDECFNKLKDARMDDALPFRVVPEINSYIRSIKQKNIIVVDPVKDMMGSINNLYQYKDFFVDFQHPSQLGHAIIANNILAAIYPNEIIPDSFNIELCGISWEKNGKIEKTLADKSSCIESYQTNIRWLDNIIAVQPVSFQYDYYKSRSERSLKALFEDSKLN